MGWRLYCVRDVYFRCIGAGRTDIHVSIISLFGQVAGFQAGLPARRRPPFTTASLFSGNPGVESGIPDLSVRICRRLPNSSGSCREEIP
jgi:hypothetical protein